MPELHTSIIVGFNEIARLIGNTGLYIAFAFVFGLIAKMINLPPLVGFLVAGFGLNLLGYGDPQGLSQIAHIGVLLMLFTIGLRIRLQNIARFDIWSAGLGHILIFSAVSALMFHFIFAFSWMVAGLIACALSFSSTVVAAKSLDEKNELGAFHGRIAIGILIVQDLVAIALLSATQGHMPSLWALLLLALVPLRKLLHRLLDIAGHNELLLLFGISCAFLGGVLFEVVGFSEELGALVLGCLCASSQKSSELFRALWTLREIFLVGFFLMIGITAAPTTEIFLFSALLLLLLPFKAVLFHVLLIACKLRARSSLLAGIALTNYSEFGLIVIQATVMMGLAPEKWVTILAITIALSFVVSASLNNAAHGIYARFAMTLNNFERSPPAVGRHRIHPDDEPMSLGIANIAVFGMGRVGASAYDCLKQRGENVIGLDADQGKVHDHRQQGRRVLYADAEDPYLWKTLDLSGLRAMLLTMPDMEAKELAIKGIRDNGYQGLLGATNLFVEEEEQIKQLGCAITYNYYSQAGVGFADKIWHALHPELDPQATTAIRSNTAINDG